MNRAAILAQIVEIANLMDEQMELMPYEFQTQEQVLEGIRNVSQDDWFLPDIVLALTSLPRVRREDLIDIVYRLPVFPGLALKALGQGSDSGMNFAQLYELAMSDPVLAGDLLQVANSSSPSRRIANIGQAITSIGMHAARKVLMAAVLRPFFLSARLTELWNHSVTIAQCAERLATISGRADPAEAFLSGLVHDVGALAMEKLNGEAAAARERILQCGCEPIFVERILCRFDHAELGGDILQRWNFPEGLSEGVRRHHQPEQTESPLSAILYLAEYWCASEEDLPSAFRLNLSLDRTGLTFDRMREADDRHGLVDTLIYAA